MEMSFLDTLAMVALWIRKPKQTFLQEIAGHCKRRGVEGLCHVCLHTLFRSKTRKLRSAAHVNRRRRQCHPRPTETHEILHDHEGNLFNNVSAVPPSYG